MVEWLARIVEEVDRQYDELPSWQKSSDNDKSPLNASASDEGRAMSTAKEPRYE